MDVQSSTSRAIVTYEFVYIDTHILYIYSICIYVESSSSRAIVTTEPFGAPKATVTVAAKATHSAEYRVAKTHRMP